MSSKRGYRITRQSPTDLDDESPLTNAPPEFDYRHRGGAKPWPERHRFTGIKFGPVLIKRAWAAGLVVYAEVDGIPYPVAVKEACWDGANVFHVVIPEGKRIPRRIFTRPDARGLTASGLLIEGEK